MKRVISIILALIMTLSLCACGGSNAGDPNALVQSKGLFLLERTAGKELDSLTDQQTYLIHIYDIIPDDTKNVDMGAFSDYYSITLNDENSYVPIGSPASYNIGTNLRPSQAAYFWMSSGYADPPELGTVLAGGEPIRCMSVYVINTIDIKDDMSAVFTIEGCDVYNCSLKFTRDDIVSIQYFDEVYQIEDNPIDYQIAAEFFQRVRLTCETVMRASDDAVYFKHKYGTAFYETCLSMISGVKEMNISYSVTADTDFINTSHYHAFDPEAVKRIYPGLSVDEFEDAVTTWVENGQIAIDAYKSGKYNAEAAKLTDSAVKNIKELGQQIIDYYIAKIYDK